MAPEPPVLLYAEYLANIGRISVMAELRTKSSSSTTAYISADGLSMNVCHENVATTITLPARTQPAARLPLSQGKIELSWRLPLADEVPRQSAVDLSDSAKAPWSASGIRPGAEICCRSCDCVIVAGCVKIWKDLPSENWAEMMDFWHCHKPDNNHDHDHNSKHEANQDLTAKKGYGAGKRFKSERGCGFVDLTYLQINPEDCTSINLSLTNSTLRCKNCSAYLGILDAQRSSNRLYKWSIAISSHANPEPPLAQFIAAHLLSQIASQAVSKFVLHCKAEPSTPTLHIWVFAPHLMVSMQGSLQRTAVCKIFYKIIAVEEKTRLLDETHLVAAVEEILLNEEAIREIEGGLKRSTNCLPTSARKFGEWNVGLLERYDGD